MQTVLKKFGMAGAIALAMLLTACGGGGGGGDVGAATAVNNVNTNAPRFVPNNNPPVCADPVFTPPASLVNLSGTATFASVPNNTATGALNYAGIVTKPVRGATVQAIAGNCTVVASGTTSDQGAYTLQVPANTYVFVRLRAELVNTTGPAKWRVAVKDNTAGEALWVVDGAGASSGNATSTRTINAGSGWNGVSSYTGPRGAGAFAILDTVYSSMKVVTQAQPAAQFPNLTMYWSPNNKPARGNLAAGEIGTSFFATGVINGVLERAIFILGAQNSDTDEYDSAVVAHEYGHYLQSAFSTNDSLGGAHGPGDKLDMTVAFSEGWGYAWAGMARGTFINTDSYGAAQSQGVVTNLRTVPTNANRGWYWEDSIQALLYQLYESQGFAPIWAALTGPMKNTQDAVASIFSFASAVRDAGNAAVTNAMNTLLTAQNIFAGTGANQWGNNETNNGGDASNLPIYSTLAFNTPTPVCFINTNVRTTDTSPNKLGAVKYLRINLSATQAGIRTITASFPVGRDVDFEVFQNRQTVASADSTDPTSEVTSVSLASGEVVIRVLDFVTTNPTCATLTIN
jgi:hypothetical protein